MQDRPAGFFYPNFVDPLYVIDLDDLEMDTFLVMCSREDTTVYLWRGPEFQEDDEEMVKIPNFYF